MYKKLATIVRFCHWAWLITYIGFVCLFVILSIAFPESTALAVGLAAVAYALIIAVSSAILGGCPLRLIEESLRKRDNPNFSYNGSFVAYHIGKILKVKPPPAIIITILLVSSIIISLFVFAYHWCTKLI